MDKPSPMHQQGRAWRQELFFKSQTQLQTTLPFLRTRRLTIHGVNVPNKTPDDQLLDSVRDLVSAGIRDVCVHYSIKNQPQPAAPPLSQAPLNTGRRGRGADPAAAAVAAGSARLAAFMQELGSISTGATDAELGGMDSHGTGGGGGGNGGGSVSVLLVSGGGKKKAFNTVSALQEMQRARQQAESTSDSAMLNAAANPDDIKSAGSAATAVAVGIKRSALEQPRRPGRRANVASAAGSAASGVPLGGLDSPCLASEAPRSPCDSPSHPRIFVAFNPYLPDAAVLAVEYARLKQKLATGIPSGIYLQVRQEISGNMPRACLLYHSTILCMSVQVCNAVMPACSCVPAKPGV